MKLITWIVLLIFARVPWLQKADSLINPPLMQQAESILRFHKGTDHLRMYGSRTACRKDTAGRNRYDCTDLSSEESSRNDRYGRVRLSVLLGKAPRSTSDPDRECSSRSG